MSAVDVLSSPAIGNLIVLIAALVGVGGSYYLYLKRLEKRKDSARRAIRSELEAMDILDQWVEGMTEVPHQSIITTSAYEAHLENIGLLSKEEVEKITDFYSSAIILDDMIKHHRERVLEVSLEGDLVERGKKKRESDIASNIDHLSVRRWQLVQILNKNLGDPFEDPGLLDIPSEEGDILHHKHPLVRSNKEKLLSEDIIAPSEDSEMYILTENGEEYIDDVVDDPPGF